MTTKKKQYEKPSVKAFELKQQTQLLAGSAGQAGVQDYNWQSEDEE